MRRVFQTAEIESLCQELKSILEACKGHVEAMKSCATQAENALNEVPWQSGTVWRCPQWARCAAP